MGDFLCIAETNFRDWQKVVFLAGINFCNFKLVAFLKLEIQSKFSYKRPRREFRKVVATRAGRLRGWALLW